MEDNKKNKEIYIILYEKKKKMLDMVNNKSLTPSKYKQILNIKLKEVYHE